jgi:hypothetical protein
MDMNDLMKTTCWNCQHGDGLILCEKCGEYFDNQMPDEDFLNLPCSKVVN